jgi:N-methylhydantoinase B/oxoprolinase/acetone carboxylase alpha subunit
MANDRGSAFLAHITDTVTDMREEQRAMLTVLTRLVETSEAQTEMLAEILGAARQEAGPSETAQQLAALIAAVQENSRAIESMAEQLGALPVEVGAEIANALREEPRAAKP